MRRHACAFAAIFILTATTTTCFAEMVTGVTDEPRVTMSMGLKMFPAIDPPDSASWPKARTKAFERWRDLQSRYPGSRSTLTYVYLDRLAAAFASTLPEPHPRFRFFVADTLNASIWPLSSGFFVVHAGILSLIRDESLLTFAIALELAHDSLGHTAKLADKVRLGEKEKKSFVVWPWAVLAESDPVREKPFSYSVLQESAALDLVSSFYKAAKLDYKSVAARIAPLLESLSAKQSVSSWPGLHSHLAEALETARPESKAVQATVELAVTADMVSRAVAEIETSGLQRYPWLRELFSDQPSEIAASYLKAIQAVEKRDWQALDSAAKKGLRSSPQAEPFLRYQMMVWQQTAKFARCFAQRAVEWGYFDHLRELMAAQCVFLDGRYTDARALFEEYHRRYPQDIQGAFWLVLIDLRLKRPVEAPLADIESFWGDRPYMRALRAMRLGGLGQPTEAARSFDFEDRIEYESEEWGALDMAHSWLEKTFSSSRELDVISLRFRSRAEQRWALGEQVLRHF